MTIESRSWPDPISQWPDQQPFHLQVFGETNPQVNTAYAEFQPKGTLDKPIESGQDAPVYEYWWTLAAFSAVREL